MPGAGINFPEPPAPPDPTYRENVKRKLDNSPIFVWTYYAITLVGSICGLTLAILKLLGK